MTLTWDAKFADFSWLCESPAWRLNYGAQGRGSCDAHATADDRIVLAYRIGRARAAPERHAPI